MKARKQNVVLHALNWNHFQEYTTKNFTKT